MYNLNSQHLKFLAAGLLLLPAGPFLYLQGRYTRWKVGRLPDAAGDQSGVFDKGPETLRILTFGESTVAGVGAKNHKSALTGQFAKHLGTELGKSVEWYVVGKSGIKIDAAIKELMPEVPHLRFDLIVIALGGNDVFGLSSPRKWRAGLQRLIREFQSRNDGAEIFVANVPMVRDFLAMPDPLRYLLSKLAKAQHFNSIDLIENLEDVHYFSEVERVEDEFFSDGIHPSAFGYDSWAESLVKSYLSKTTRR